METFAEDFLHMSRSMSARLWSFVQVCWNVVGSLILVIIFCSWPDMEFVQKFTPPDFQAKNFTPSISPNFNSFSKKKHKKMSENGETYTAGKNFTLPPALTAWTNSTSAQMVGQCRLSTLVLQHFIAANLVSFKVAESQSMLPLGLSLSVLEMWCFSPCGHSSHVALLSLWFLPWC